MLHFQSEFTMKKILNGREGSRRETELKCDEVKWRKWKCLSEMKAELKTTPFEGVSKEVCKWHEGKHTV